MADKIVQWVKQATEFNTSDNDISWENYTSGNGDSIRNSFPIATDAASGELYFTHIVKGTITGATTNDIVVGKLNSSGSLMWIKQHPALNPGSPSDPSIAVGSDGIFIFFSTTGTVSGQSASVGSSDTVLVKLDKTTGNIVWTKQDNTVNTINNDWASSIVVDSANNITVAFTVDTGTTTRRVTLVKYDTSGNKTYSSTNLFDIITAANTTGRVINEIVAPILTIDSADNMYVAVRLNTSGTANTRRQAIVKINPDLTTGWVSNNNGINTNDIVHLSMIKCDNSGNIVGVFNSNNTVTGGSPTRGHDIFVYKLNASDGNILWIKQHSQMQSLNLTTGWGQDDFRAYIDIDSTNSIYILYNAEGTPNGVTKFHLNYDESTDIVVAKLDSNGNFVSLNQSPSLNTLGRNIGAGIKITTAGDLYLAYMTNGLVSGGTNPDMRVSAQNYQTGFINAVAKINLTNNAMSWRHQDIYVTGQRANYNPSYNQLAGLSNIIASDKQGYLYVAVNLSTRETVGAEPNIINDRTRIVLYKLDSDGKLCWVLSDGLPDSSKMTSAAKSSVQDMIIDNEGNCILCMSVEGAFSGATAVGSTDAAIIKISSAGEILWVKQDRSFLTTSEDSGGGGSICVDADNNIYYGAVTRGTITGDTINPTSNFTPMIAKFDKNGNTQYAKILLPVSDGTRTCRYMKISTNGNNIAMTFCKDGSSGVILADPSGQSAGQSELIIVMLDMNGSIVWARQRSAFNTIGSEVYSDSSIDVSGNIYAVYNASEALTGGRWGGSDIIITKMNSDGTIGWVRQNNTFNSSSEDIFPRLYNDQINKKLYFVYRTNGSISGGSGTGSKGDTDIVLASINYDGTGANARQGLLPLNTIYGEDPPHITINNGFAYIVYPTNAIHNPNAAEFPRSTYDMIYAKLSSTPTETTTSLVIPFVSPSAVTNITTTGVTLSWRAPDGVVTGYRIYREVDGGADQLAIIGAITTTNGVSTTTVYGLTSSTNYQLKVAAYNSAGEGPKRRFPPFVTLPVQPTNITTTQSGTNTIVSWTAPSGNLSQYAVYNVNGVTETFLAYSTSTTATIPTASITGTVGVKALGRGKGRSATGTPGAVPPPTTESSTTDIATYVVANIATAPTTAVSILNNITDDSGKLQTAINTIIANKGASSAISYLSPLITESALPATLDKIASSSVSSALTAANFSKKTTTATRYTALKDAITEIQTATVNPTVITSAVASIFASTGDTAAAAMSVLTASRLSPSLKSTYFSSLANNGVSNLTVSNSTVLSNFKSTLTLGVNMSSSFSAASKINVIVPSTNTISINEPTQYVPNYLAITPGTPYTLSSNSGTATISYNGSTLSVNGSTVALGDVFTVGGLNYRIDAIGTAAVTYVGLVGQSIYVPCFFGNAPIKTPAGYRRMDSLAVGDKVLTPTGNAVAVERVKKYMVEAGPLTNPYIIPAGKFGAERRVLISPDHKICMADGRRVEAKRLGLVQEDRDGMLSYYNLELEGEADMVVSGVAVESLAHVRRVVVTTEQFMALMKQKYGTVTPSVIENVKRTCRILTDGRIEIPIQKKSA